MKETLTVIWSNYGHSCFAVLAYFEQVGRRVDQLDLESLSGQLMQVIVDDFNVTKAVDFTGWYLDYVGAVLLSRHIVLVVEGRLILGQAFHLNF